MMITKELLEKWNACSDGKQWFIDKFPQGGQYHEVMAALDADERTNDRVWFVDKCYSNMLANPELLAAEKLRTESMILDGMKASGYNSKLAASGYNSQLAASGNNSQLAASGYNSQLAASGNYSKLAASGNNSKLAASGDNSVIAAAAFGCTFTLGKGGCATIPYHDGNRVRFANAYEGENVEAGKAYRVDNTGAFIEVVE